MIRKVQKKNPISTKSDDHKHHCNNSSYNNSNGSKDNTGKNGDGYW